MRDFVVFLVTVASLPFVAPTPVLTVFELSVKIIEITKSLLETVVSLNEFADTADPTNKKVKFLFSSLDSIAVQTGEINEKIHQAGK